MFVNNENSKEAVSRARGNRAYLLGSCWCDQYSITAVGSVK